MNKKIRVCFPFNRGKGVGGAEISSVYMAEELMRVGVDIRFAIHKEEYIAKYLSSRGHNYDILDGCKAIRKSTESYTDFIYSGMRALPRVMGYIRKNRIDIVHTNGKDMHRTWAVPTRLSGARHIWHERGRFRFNKMDCFVASFSDAFISISDHSYKLAPRKLANRTRRINNPISMDQPDIREVQKIRKEILGDREGRIVGVFSRLENSRKRIGLFLEVAKSLIVNSGNNIHFLICGRGDPHVIENITREIAPFANRFHIKGLVHPVTPWMAAVDCVVAPAINESLGRTPLEASALDIPVVAARDGGHIETVIDGVTGYLAEPDNIEDFSAKIRQALEGKISGRDASEARVRLLQKYDPRLNAELVKQVYYDLLEY